MRFVLGFCLLCFLVSCSGSKNELLPRGLAADSVISRDQMINVLVDVHLIEAALMLQRNRRENIPLLTHSYYQWLCSKYHISLQRFRDNLNYYKSDPRDFSKMYEEVLKNLTDQSMQSNIPVSKKLYNR